MAAGCDPYAIRVALADQIRAYISADINVYPNGRRNPANPSIQVLADSEYISYIETFGAAGQGIMRLRLLIETTATDDDSEFALISQLLSVGTNKGASVPDAVMSDRTLGGAVADCIVLFASDPVEGDPDRPSGVTIPVQIVFSKIGAKV